MIDLLSISGAEGRTKGDYKTRGHEYPEDAKQARKRITSVIGTKGKTRAPSLKKNATSLRERDTGKNGKRIRRKNPKGDKQTQPLRFCDSSAFRHERS